MTKEELEFWHSYIDEVPAADFIGRSPRTLQEWRQKGRGPKYYRTVAGIRYTRHDLREDAESGVAHSTRDYACHQRKPIEAHAG
jgi:hypothetical protein